MKFKFTRVRRFFAAGVTGVLIMLVSAGAVAADGLTTPIPGQDPNAPVQVVTTPGFTQTGTATNPFTFNGNGVTTNQTVIVNGQYFFVDASGQYIPYYANNVGFGNGFGYGCGVTVYCGGNGNFGYTAAGPIIGFDQNGNPLVRDIRGGGTSVDAYTRDANGRVCEADSRGDCQK